MLLVLALSGCATSDKQSEVLAARPLVAPLTLGGDGSVSQIVRGAFGEREMTLNCVVSVSGANMTVVGLSAMGVRVFTLRYDGREVQIDNTLPVPAQLTPQRLLADLQLVFWPFEPLQQQLAAADWQLTEPVHGTRRLRRDNRLVAEVHYAGADPWAGRSWLVSIEHGYTLTIDSQAL